MEKEKSNNKEVINIDEINEKDDIKMKFFYSVSSVIRSHQYLEQLLKPILIYQDKNHSAVLSKDTLASKQMYFAHDSFVRELVKKYEQPFKELSSKIREKAGLEDQLIKLNVKGDKCTDDEKKKIEELKLEIGKFSIKLVKLNVKDVVKELKSIISIVKSFNRLNINNVAKDSIRIKGKLNKKN